MFNDNAEALDGDDCSRKLITERPIEFKWCGFKSHGCWTHSTFRQCANYLSYVAHIVNAGTKQNGWSNWFWHTTWFFSSILRVLIGLLLPTFLSVEPDALFSHLRCFCFFERHFDLWWCLVIQIILVACLYVCVYISLLFYSWKDSYRCQIL